MSALVLFLIYEIEIGDGPGPELDKYTSPNPSLLYMGWGFINIYLDFFCSGAHKLDLIIGTPKKTS